MIKITLNRSGRNITLQEVNNGKHRTKENYQKEYNYRKNWQCMLNQSSIEVIVVKERGILNI